MLEDEESGSPAEEACLAIKAAFSTHLIANELSRSCFHRPGSESQVCARLFGCLVNIIT